MSYLHGSAAPEQDRLARMNALINEACLRVIAPRGERSALDLGSGLGQFTRALARALGQGARVLGIEADDAQRASAERLAVDDREAALVEFRAGRAEAPPLRDDESGSFDLAHARFLLEHHRAPLDVVRAMVHAVAPGGRIVLLDDDHEVLRLWPQAPATMTLWQSYVRGYERLGCDPFVGRRLPALLAAAGAAPQRAALVDFGACAGQPQFEGLVANLARVMDSARSHLVREELAEAADFDAMHAELATWSRRPGATIWYSIAFAEGRKPA
ncbi:MAG: methyltransferase domain-containing protein [Planctomycetes bacterium]|nr:methyltransferase domain-containing protein [Planctomycetota bacterium]